MIPYLAVFSTSFLGYFYSNVISIPNASFLTIKIVSTLCGALWGLLISLLSPKSPKSQRVLCYVSCLIMSMLSGGSLFAMFMYMSMLHQPEAILSLIRPPFGGGFLFFVTFNTILELVLYPCLLSTIKGLDIISFSAILYYLSRAATYVYFVPKIFHFMTLEPTIAAADSAVVTEVLQWIKLSWIRCAIDCIASVMLFIAIHYKYPAQVAPRKKKE